MSSASDFQVGQKAQLLSDNSIGIVRYIGSIHVAQGDFIGLELSGATGRNDGSVQGTRYFQCPPKHGIFIKPGAAKPVIAPSTSPTSSSSSVPVPGPRKLSRLSMAPPTATALKKPATSRLSMAPPAKRQSIAPGPSRVSPTSRQPVRAPPGKITPVEEVQSQTSEKPAIKFDVQNEELKAKIAVLEGRRDEREALLSTALAEKDKYAGLVQKLEAKLRPLSEEVQELRTRAQEWKQSQREAETAQEEQELTLESLALDRELALESNDKLRAEVEELKFKVDELELQNQIYQEEKALEQEDSEEEYHPQDLVHLRVENKRMREALLKLRDLTKSEKADLELQISQLQAETIDLPEVKVKNAELQQQLGRAQEVIDHQKSQIDGSEDNESLIMAMQSQLEAGTTKVTELETLIEFGNESEEINKQIIISLEEAQRSTQADLEHYKALFQAATERIVGYERTIADQDDTVEKYRKLTSTLQSNLREAQGSQEVSQHEKAVAEKRAQHLQDLAKETRKSAERTQLRDYENRMTILRRDLAQKELHIIKAYIPESYHLIEGSVQSLLTIKTINGKLRALNELLTNKTNEPVAINYDANKVIRPKLIIKLGYLDLLTDQVEEYFSIAPVETFFKFGELNNELQSIDKAVDTWTSSLTKDSPVDTKILDQAEMYTKFLDNVAEVHLPQRNNKSPSIPETALDYSRQLQRIDKDLANLQGCLEFMKETWDQLFPLDGKAADDDDDDDDEDDELDREQREEHNLAFTKIKMALENVHTREARMLRMAGELKKQNMTIDEDIEDKISLSMSTMTEATDIAFVMAERLVNLLNDEDREFDVTILDLRPIFGNIPYSTLLRKLDESLKYLTAGRDLMDNPDHLNEVVEEAVISPWTAHNTLLKKGEIDVQDLTQQLATARTELLERNTAIAVNKKTIEELNVSVEVLNKRIADSANKTDRSAYLEREFKVRTGQNEVLRLEVDRLEALLKQATTAKPQIRKPSPTGASRIPVPVTASSGDTTSSILKRQVAALESTVREMKMAASQQQLSTVHFEALQPERTAQRKQTSALAERAGANMKAALDRLAMQKKDKKKAKKTSATRQYWAAEQALEGFRMALQK